MSWPTISILIFFFIYLPIVHISFKYKNSTGIDRKSKLASALSDKSNIHNIYNDYIDSDYEELYLDLVNWFLNKLDYDTELIFNPENDDLSMDKMYAFYGEEPKKFHSIIVRLLAALRILVFPFTRRNNI